MPSSSKCRFCPAGMQGPESSQSSLWFLKVSREKTTWSCVSSAYRCASTWWENTAAVVAVADSRLSTFPAPHLPVSLLQWFFTFQYTSSCPFSAVLLAFVGFFPSFFWVFFPMNSVAVSSRFHKSFFRRKGLNAAGYTCLPCSSSNMISLVLTQINAFFVR